MSPRIDEGTSDKMRQLRREREEANTKRKSIDEKIRQNNEEISKKVRAATLNFELVLTSKTHTQEQRKNIADDAVVNVVC